MSDKTSLVASYLQTQKQGANIQKGFKTGPIQQASCSEDDLGSSKIIKKTISSSTS